MKRKKGHSVARKSGRKNENHLRAEGGLEWDLQREENNKKLKEVGKDRRHSE